MGIAASVAGGIKWQFCVSHRKARTRYNTQTNFNAKISVILFKQNCTNKIFIRNSIINSNYSQIFLEIRISRVIESSLTLKSHVLLELFKLFRIFELFKSSESFELFKLFWVFESSELLELFKLFRAFELFE